MDGRYPSHDASIRRVARSIAFKIKVRVVMKVLKVAGSAGGRTLAKAVAVTSAELAQTCGRPRCAQLGCHRATC